MVVYVYCVLFYQNTTTNSLKYSHFLFAIFSFSLSTKNAYGSGLVDTSKIFSIAWHVHENPLCLFNLNLILKFIYINILIFKYILKLNLNKINF